MKPFKKFMYKYISGGLTLRIKGKEYGMPKTALFIFPSFILGSISRQELSDPLTIIAISLFVIGAISYCYPLINPLTLDELEELKKG